MTISYTVNTTHIFFILSLAGKISKTIFLTTLVRSFLLASHSLSGFHFFGLACPLCPLGKECSWGFTPYPKFFRTCHSWPDPPPPESPPGLLQPHRAKQVCEGSLFSRDCGWTSPLHKCGYLRNSRSPQLWGSHCGSRGAWLCQLCVCAKVCACRSVYVWFGVHTPL